MGYDNTNKGTLGKNDKKESDKHPGYKGKLDINGTQYWLSGWVREVNGSKFISISATKADEKYQKKNEPKNESVPQKKEESTPDDMLPF